VSFREVLKMTVLSKMADAKEDEEYAVAFKRCKVLVTVPKSPQIGASSTSSSSADSEKMGRIFPDRDIEFTDEDRKWSPVSQNI
jgi:hypothetical protein